MDTAVGAATWPTGDQVWNGHRPASTPKPRNRNGKTIVWNRGLKAVAASRVMSKVWARRTRRRAPATAGSTSAVPASRYRVSFIAPYSLRVLPQTAMSRYIGSTATS